MSLVKDFKYSPAGQMQNHTKTIQKLKGENKKIIRKLIYTYKYRSILDNCTQEPTFLDVHVGC